MAENKVLTSDQQKRKDKFLRRQAKLHNDLGTRQVENERQRQMENATMRDELHEAIDAERIENLKLRVVLMEKLEAIQKIEDPEAKKAAFMDPELEAMIHAVDRWQPEKAARERKRKQAEKLRAELALSEERKAKRDAHRAQMKKGRIKF